eukprot:scaffold241566_cov17-Prasinocladus_malaysianus.AAC.2
MPSSYDTAEVSNASCHCQTFDKYFHVRIFSLLPVSLRRAHILNEGFITTAAMSQQIVTYWSGLLTISSTSSLTFPML